MQINFNKIEEIHGMDIINLITENLEDVVENINYMVKLEFNDVEDIFERYVQIFICDNNEFVSKINNFLKKIGNNYVEIIENNLDLLEVLLW